MNDNAEKLFLQALNGQKTERVPFWFMRQAGRYLPEYRELRAQKNGFLDMAYDPEAASEITLQPIRRFGMDAAIIFSDILVVPHALGQALDFVAGEGPKLDALRGPEDFIKLDPDNSDYIFQNVYAALEQTAHKLKAEKFSHTALIGFAGAPWTVACYMIEGGGSKEFELPRIWAYRDPDSFQTLIDILVETTIKYLAGQIRAGAQAVQIFDSWSGILSSVQFYQWVIEPTKRIVDELRKDFPATPIIGFPRGAGPLYRDYCDQTGVNAVSTDHGLSTPWIAAFLQPDKTVQGNLDPVALLTGGQALKSGALSILDDLSGGPFVFNLGHGVIKETPIAHVEQLCELIRTYKK